MNSIIAFDLYQTLIFKSGLEERVRNFLLTNKGIDMTHSDIVRANREMYTRRKLKHKSFANEKERQSYFINYNQEFLAILGVSLSIEESEVLNHDLKNLPYELYDDVITALDAFKKNGYMLGIISNWAQFSIKEILEMHNIEHYFDFIHLSSVIGFSKPDERIFEDVLRLAQEQKKEKIYYVGDDYELDIASAQKVGIIPILIDRLNMHIAPTCKKITSLTDLTKFIHLE